MGLFALQRRMAGTLDREQLRGLVYIRRSLKEWLRCPCPRHGCNPYDLGALLDPEWLSAPGEAILDSGRLPNIVWGALAAARGELVLQGIQEAGLVMSDQPNGDLLRDPRFEDPAMETIMKVMNEAVEPSSSSGVSDSGRSRSGRGLVPREAMAHLGLVLVPSSWCPQVSLMPIQYCSER